MPWRAGRSTGSRGAASGFAQVGGPVERLHVAVLDRELVFSVLGFVGTVNAMLRVGVQRVHQCVVSAAGRRGTH